MNLQLTTPQPLLIPDDIVATLRSHTDQLEMVPAIAGLAMEIARDPDCNIREFAAVVERDAVLAGNVLRLANSAMYLSGVPVLSLNQAVVKIGLQQCRNLITASSIASLMNELPLSEEWARESLSRHGFITGMLATKLNRALSIGGLGEEFTAGLMHDFGRMLIVLCFPEKFQEVDDLGFDEEMPTLLNFEKQALSVDHAELGAWFAKENDLPDALVDVVRFHHEPELASNKKLTYLTAVCDHMANHLQRNGSTTPYDIETNPFIDGLEACGVRNAKSRLTEITDWLMEDTLVEVDQLVG